MYNMSKLQIKTIITTNHLQLSTTSAWVSEESSLLSEALQVAVGWAAMVQDAATPHMTKHSQNSMYQSTIIRNQSSTSKLTVLITQCCVLGRYVKKIIP